MESTTKMTDDKKVPEFLVAVALHELRGYLNDAEWQQWQQTECTEAGYAAVKAEIKKRQKRFQESISDAEIASLFK